MKIQTELAAISKPTYCLYARKSSEDDERQAMSIDSQIKEMLRIAEREGLDVAAIQKESHSAKSSGCRPVFNQLISEIRDGKFQGIITWAPDRLSRNAGDLGLVVDLMDKGKLQVIRTQSKKFSNSPDDKFLMMILCSQAKLENDNRGINVKRGLRAKCERGSRPGPVPLGYKLIRSENLREPSQIIIDEERASFIKKMFHLIVSKGFSGRQVHEQITKEGFRTKNGKVLTLSMLYRIFRETFYYGEFEYPKESGTWYQGTHEPLITKKQFKVVQQLLKTSEKSKWGSQSFSFSRLLKCGHCQSGISGEERVNRFGKHYTYYKCNKYGGNQRCHSKYIREEKLIEALAMIVDEVSQNSKLQQKIQKEVTRFNALQAVTNKENVKPISAQNYLAYMLKNGSYLERRQILLGIPQQLFLEEGRVRFGR
uniref:Site-specific DNA recombinase n=1 Tax=Candidatus Kentrum sp. LPFa TaxID=2126335 RepID=A0A450XN76_9GAMM|nr:MAG: Site-specific DNA recombinase [Candidatus Kentron sp. LPFa]